MPQLLKIPREVENVLGQVASDKFYDFLNQALDEQKDKTLELSDDKFSKKLVETGSKLEKQILGFENRLVETEAKLEKQISALRVEMNEKLTDIHKQIANQTKWILAAILGAVVLYPILNKIVNRILP